MTSRASHEWLSEVFVWGHSPSELYISLLVQHQVQDTLVLLPVGALYHRTPNTIELARCFSTILAEGRETGKQSGPFIPWLKLRGFLAHVLQHDQLPSA